MSNPEIYDKWTKFTTHPSYTEYFMSNEEQWDLTLEQRKH